MSALPPACVATFRRSARMVPDQVWMLIFLGIALI